MYKTLKTVLLLTGWLIAISWAPMTSANETTTGSEELGNYYGAIETVYPDWFKTSFMELAEDVLEAREEGKRVMLVFHQDGCPYCNAFVERNLAQKDIEETLRTHFDVIEINMWGEREIASVDGQEFTEKSFSEALKVQFTPTVIFLSDTGDIALRINGYTAPDKFRIALQYLLDEESGETSFNDYLAARQVKSSAAGKPAGLIERDYFTGPVEELSKRPGADKKPLLLIFEQKDCPNCDFLHDEVLAREKSQKELKPFDIYQIDLWGNKPFGSHLGTETTGRALGAELGVSYAPTMILYDADGTEVIRSEGWFKSFHTQGILYYVSSGAWREQPNFQRYLSARSEELREQGIDVNIWD